MKESTLNFDHSVRKRRKLEKFLQVCAMDASLLFKQMFKERNINTQFWLENIFFWVLIKIFFRLKLTFSNITFLLSKSGTFWKISPTIQFVHEFSKTCSKRVRL